MPVNNRPIQRNFTGGEQSPALDARADLDRFANSLALEENFVSLPTGGMEHTPGTRFCGVAQGGSDLVAFAYSDSDGYAIEFGNLKARLYRDNGFVESAPGSGLPYEFDTPFVTGEFLYPAQRNNVMFIATGVRPIQKLIRNDALDWAVADSAFTNGPFIADNPDDAIVLYAPYTDPAPPEWSKGLEFDLKAFGGDVFSADMVGAFMLIKEADKKINGSWLTGSARYNTDDFTRYGGNSYKAIDRGNGDHTTGPNPPIHLIGAEWDGPTNGHGMEWLYLHSGRGVVKISEFIDAGHVKAVAQSYVPIEVWATEEIDGGTVTSITGGTNRWAEGAWSDKRGYPSVVFFHGDRLVAARTPGEPERYWQSCTDDYENMDGGRGEDDKAFSKNLLSNNKINGIMWGMSGQRMAVGTSGDEFVIQGSAVREALTPSNATTLPATDEGSARVRPVKVGSPIFVSPDGRRVFRMGYDFSADEFVAQDLTEAADHVTGSGVKGMAFQRVPYSILWCFREDGQLIGCTLRKAQQVIGWHRHPRSGRVTALCAVPNPDGKNVDLWLRMERDLPGGTVAYIESMQRFFNRGDLDLTKAWFVDSGVMYDGPPVTVVGGANHLIGAEVFILADGQTHPRRVVQPNGSVILQRLASRVILGLYSRGKALSLRYDRNFDGGATSGRPRIVKSIALDVQNSVGLKVAAGDKEDGELVKPSGGFEMNAPSELQNGVSKAVAVPDSWNVNGQICVIQDQPLPASIRAWTPNVQVSS